MKCSTCNKDDLNLIKIESKLLCRSCLNDLVKKEDDVESSEELDYKIFDIESNDVDGQSNAFQNQSGVDQDNFTVKIEKDEIKQELKNPDDEYSKQFAIDGEENASLGENSHQTVQDEDAPYEDIQIKDELTLEEAKIQHVDDDDYMEDNKNDKKLKCRFCTFRCCKHRELKNHTVDSHSEVRLISCSICSNQYQGETLYRQHVQDEHDGFGGVCKICLEKFRESSEVQLHKAQCLGRPLFVCFYCENKYTSPESVLKHLDGNCIAGNVNNRKFIEKRILQQFFTCELCEDDRAYEKDPYWKHIKEAHNGHFIRCKYCPSTFTTKSTRARHMKFMCIASEQFVKQDLKCPNCQKKFTTQHSLDVHIKTVHLPKPIKCEVCQVQCKNVLALYYHRKTTHRKPEYQCPYCPKKFHHASYYRKHVEMHQNERKILCELCGLAFNTQCNYKSHLRSRHLADAEFPKKSSDGNAQPQYECKECSKSFVKRVNYDNHMMLHNPEQQRKPKYFCAECNLIFTSKVTIQTHFKHSITHRKVKCKKCKAVFASAKGYDEHIRNKMCSST